MPELRFIKRLFRYFVFAVAFAAIAEPAGAQIIERELHRGVTEGPSHLDPQYASRAVEQSILSDLFMGLVAEDAAGQPIPGMAESWEIKQKGRRWIFKLRAGLKWSDGRPLVAGDFVYAFQRMLAPQSVAPYASMFYPIAGARSLHASKAGDPATLGVTAKDKRTLIFDLEQPTPYFLALLVHPTAFPLRKDLIEKGGDGWTRPGRMVSNGPYILAEWLPGRYVKLRKNWDFFDPATVYIDNIFYDIVDTGEVALERFFSGDLAVLSGIPRERIAGLMETAPEAVRLYPTLTTDYMVFNTKKPPFNDPRVRQALALAIDSRSLVNIALDQGEIPASGMLPEGMANLHEPAQLVHEGPYPVRRPLSPSAKRKKAKQLLADAGHGANGALRITLHYNNSDTHQKVADAIANMWDKIGVSTDLYGNHYNVHYGDLGLGDFDVARAGWIADYNDPTSVLELFLSGNERFNYGTFADKEFEKLLSQAAAQSDPRERAIGLYRAHQRAMGQYPVVPLYHHASRNLVAPAVTGWEDNVRDIHPSRYLNLAD